MKRLMIFSLCFIFIFAATGLFGQVNLRQKKRTPEQKRWIKQAIDRRAEKLTDGQEQQALDFLRQLDAPAADHLQQLKSENPDAYQRRVLLIYREMNKLQAFEENEPELYDRKYRMKQLEVKEKRLAREYKEAPESEKPRIHSELRTVLDELFDLRELDRRDQISKMEQRLQQLRQTLQERAEKKDEIIEHRMEMLTHDLDELRW